jgi:hypothetical protein
LRWQEVYDGERHQGEGKHKVFFVVGLHHNRYGGKISLSPTLFLCESMLEFSEFVGLVGGSKVLIS